MATTTTSRKGRRESPTNYVTIVFFLCISFQISFWFLANYNTTTTNTTTTQSTLLSSSPPSCNNNNITSNNQQQEQQRVNNNNKGDDWFNETIWNKNPYAKKCYYVEDICHASQQFFYHPSSYNNKDDDSNNKQKHHHHHHHHQPYPFQIKTIWQPTSDSVMKFTLPQGYPPMIKVLPPNNDTSTLVSSSSTSSSCTYSMIPNHMVLFSNSDHMLGEFYARVLLGLYDIVVKGFQPSVSTQQFKHQTQLYLQLDKGQSTLLDSHQLFLGIFSSNPILHFKSLLDNTSCQCMKRLIFCGYETKEVLKDNNNEHQSSLSTTASSSSSSSSSEGMMLQPSEHVGTVKHFRFNEKNVEQYDVMRKYILKELIEDNPIIRRHIHSKRIYDIHNAIMSTFSVVDLRVLKQNGNNNTTTPMSQQFPFSHSISNIKPKEWKIVGLAQRTGRRRWLKLDQLISWCNKEFISQRIICIEVNIEREESSNPKQHILSYAGLDALIGIHGAQLTEALLMPPNALVVELLPYIFPGKKVGEWTTWTHRPTPLGVIFSSTSLNHIGYPLRRQSASKYCQNESFRLECFSTSATAWSNRDFEIDKELLNDILTKFVSPTKTKKTTTSPPSSSGTNSLQLVSCDDYQKAAGDEYVLYNINCISSKKSDDVDNDVVPSVHHFYRDKDWVRKKTVWLLQDELRMKSANTKN